MRVITTPVHLPGGRVVMGHLEWMELALIELESRHHKSGRVLASFGRVLGQYEHGSRQTKAESISN